jgi:hypothetical protein
MSEDDRLQTLLRAALPPTVDEEPRRDLWPLVASRIDAQPAWSWFDLGLATAVVMVLLLFPRGIFFLAYHL